MPLVTSPEVIASMVLPNLQVVAGNLAQGWEESVKACWDYGFRIPTQYDGEADENSRDIALNLTILDPFAEPRIHRDIPGGFEDLEIYNREVVQGVHDHWIDPANKKWQYTYHERLFRYAVPGLDEPINQIELAINELAKAWFTRRAQAITWKPWEDAGFDHAACLQSFWFRIVDGKLNMRCRIRSNDAYEAAFMNMYAFIELQRYVAEQVSLRLGWEVGVGQYDHCADSFHIYGHVFDKFTGRFLRGLETRTFAQRTYRTDDPEIRQLLAEASVAVDAKLAREKEAGQ